MMKSRFLILITFFFCQFSLFAQKDSVRLKIIEEKIDKIEKYKEISDRDFQSKSTSLDTKIDKAIADFDRHNLIIAILGALGGLGSLITGYFWILGLIRSKVNEKIETILETKKEKFQQLILSTDEEYRLRESKKIAVISNQDNTFLKGFLRNSGFKQVSYYSTENIENINTNIFFLNNETGQLDDTFIEDFAKKGKVVFYFGAYKNFLKDYEKVNFANSKFQIYSNLVNTLRYEEIINS